MINVIDRLATTPQISADDFFTGFIAGLAKSDVHVVIMNGTEFHQAVESAYARFLERAREVGAEVNFMVKRNAFHGDSPDVSQGVTRAVQRNIISLDNPLFVNMRLKIAAERADSFLEKLPGDAEWYIDAADAFLDEYSAVR